MDPNREMWSRFSRANEINPAERHRWRMIITEVRCSGAAPLVVDLGCGSGVLLSKLAKSIPGARRIGIDIESHALELGRRKDPGAEFVQADLSRGEVPASLRGQAQVVVCAEVLEHLPHPEHAVAFACDLLAPGGRFIVTVPAGGMTAFDRNIGHLRHYTPSSLRQLVEGGGLRCERLVRWGFPFHSLFRLALSVAPEAANLYRNDRLSLPARLAASVIYWLFFLNLSGGPLGRQLVAVAARPR